MTKRKTAKPELEVTEGDWHFRHGRIEAGEPVETPRGTCTTVVAALHGQMLATLRGNGRLLSASKDLWAAMHDLVEQAEIAVAKLNTALGADAQKPGNAPFHVDRTLFNKAVAKVRG
jgi:hypothetical protein